MSRSFLVIDPADGLPVLRSLASPVRLSILDLLHRKGALNVNEIAEILGLPQSTASTNIQVLSDAGLVRTSSHKARKGSQKVCSVVYDEVLVVFKNEVREVERDAVEVSMPLGLYTGFEVTAPCGLCSTESIIGLLDVPSTFLDPDRMKASLLWFTRGYVEYQFPNNARLSGNTIREIEFVMELSSEVPGTSADWPSDITLTINGVDLGPWTSPGDFGDKRGTLTPEWWKLKGSQYGKLKSFRINDDGFFVDGLRLSDDTLAGLGLEEHHSIRLRIAVRDDARHPGGINIFGRGFGNYDQDIVMRLRMR